MDPPTATLIRRDCDAFNSGDMDTVRTTFDGSIAWRCAGKSRFSGDQHGIDNTLAYFLELKQATGGTLHLDVHDVVADHEHAAALVTSSFEVGAKQYTDIGSHVVPHQGGTITEFSSFDGNPYQLDEVFPA